MPNLWSSANLKFFDSLRRKSKSPKELGEEFFKRAVATDDNRLRNKLFLTSSRYFEEAQDYDNAIKSLVLSGEEKRARTLSIKICNPLYIKKYSQNASEIVHTYIGCIIKCLSEELLGKASELSKDLLDYKKDEFIEGVFLAVNSLFLTNTADLDRALVKIQKGRTHFLTDQVRQIFIKIIYKRCKEYNIMQELFKRHTIPQICPRCHGQMLFHEDFGEAVCQYCGTKIKNTS